MNNYLLVISLVLSLALSYERINDPSTAYGSCQDALTKDPTAVDGLYYINNFGEVEPYLTLCIMSMNGGGWTLYYKNSNEPEEGFSYSSYLENPFGFVTEEDDLLSDAVSGVSPIEGLHPVSLMAMPVGSPSASSIIHFNDVDIAESVVDPSNLIEGCNSYEKTFTFVNNNSESIVNGIVFANGVISFSDCAAEGDHPVFSWMGNVFSNTTRVTTCGSAEGGQCMYFLREDTTFNTESCMCRAAGSDNMIWPATPCGEVRTISCFEGEDNGSLQRQCGADGQWESYIQGTCSCSAVAEFDTLWPTTEAGATAHVTCANDVTKSRDRLCQPNGQWADVMTNGCTCDAEVFHGIQWEATEGGKLAVHACDFGALGTGYTRLCAMDGRWDINVEGTCGCPAHYSNGVTWEESEPNHTQVAICHEDAVGTQMSRTCSVYGSWYPIEGNCDCPEEEIDHNLWPQTAAGLTARISCDENAVGTDSTRVCNPTGFWSEIQYGSCSCPSETWTNYAGTTYSFPQTAGNSEARFPCLNGLEGEIVRTCDHYGVWSTPSGCYEPVYCPAETVNGLAFESTEGGNVAMIMCTGTTSMSYGRVCAENGEWQDIIGYCQCSSIEDDLGNIYPSKKSGERFTQECTRGYEGTVSATCSVLGEWIEVENTCVRKQCPAEEYNGYNWAATDSESTATFACNGIGGGYTRDCTIDGFWSYIEGSCSCPSTYLDDVYYPQTASNSYYSLSCPYGYVGNKYRACSLQGEWGELVDNCQRVTCPAGKYEEIDWPSTIGGSSATVYCPMGDGYHRRYCHSNGQWSSYVEGTDCSCPSTTINENGIYVFPQTPGNEVVTKTCSSLYAGSISYTCSSAGTWKNLHNQCQRIMCPAETYNGIYFPRTASGTTRRITCDEDAVGNGYERTCDEYGVWSSSIEGGCSCKSEAVRHVDGHLYEFDTTEGGAVISRVCGGDLAGSIYRSCSLYGAWQSIHGECTRLTCPEETLGNYVWPVTNSSTTVEFNCNSFQIGSVSRYCHAAGVWSDPVNNCREVQCSDVTVNKLATGCMNVRFSPYETAPFVRASVVPSASPDFSIAFRGKTVRVCGLEANIAYSMFVQYCSDENYNDCSDACIMSDIYYQQTCDVMNTVDVADVSIDANGVTTLSFSVKFPTCPYPAESVELVYECIDNCPEDAEPIVETTPCTSLDGCKAGARGIINIIGEFPADAVYRIKQRMNLEDQFSELQPYSEVSEFRPRDLIQTSELEPHVEILNSRMVRLHLGEVDGVTLFKKHVIYIYKKKAGTRRRLVDSLFSTTTLCPLGNSVCEDKFTDIPVEVGYDYSFSIYSYPVVSGGKVQVSVTMTTIEPVPSFDLSVNPGDHFMTVTLSNAVYDIQGTCSFIPQTSSSGNQALIEVALKKGESASFIYNNLIVNTAYTVSCVMREQYGLENRVTVHSATTPLIQPTLELSLLSDTVYDVKIGATTNKPSTLFCAVTDYDVTPSTTELRLYGEQKEISIINAITEVSLLLPKADIGYYRVSCVAVDILSNEVFETLTVAASGTAFSPELVESVPANNAVNVDPFVEIKLQFRYAVNVNTCQFCFFILYNTATRSSTNLYSNAFNVDGNTISFMSNQLASDTTYQLKVSTGGLILDSMSNIPYVPTSDILLTFTTAVYGDVEGDIQIEDFFPVNGVLTIEYSSYLILNEGTITLNSLTIDASNVCLQIQHNTESSTTLLIPVYDCVGMLRPSSSYVLVLPKSLLVTKAGIPSPRLTHVFETSSTSYAPKMIDSFPRADDVVPTDVSVELYFDQPVSAANGFLFIAEYDGSQFMNSFNIPASQAVFSDEYPYKMTWDASYYSLKPTHTYVISWSEGLVKNLRDQVNAVSSVNENIRFNTDISACSANFLASSITGALDCYYEKNQCVCSQWNMIALVNKNVY